MPYNNDEKISASEINRYMYCPHQWYYERYYGRKLLREKYKERNEALGYTDLIASNFNKGRHFHEKYMFKDKVRRFVKVMIEIIIAVIILILLLTVLIKRPEISKAPPSLSISGYKLFYADQGVDGRKKSVIYSKQLESVKYGLYGKPDFIFKRKNKLIPVELKSGSADNEPRKGDLMQLCAYMLIIEDAFSAKVTEGRLIYKNVMFVIKNTKRLRSELLETTEQMRVMLKTGHTEAETEPGFVHCKHCVCKGTVCEYYSERI